MYEYKATILKIVDGDTFDASVDLGFDVSVRQTLRFSRIDAFETRLGATTNAEQKKLGLEGKAFLSNLLPVGTQVDIKTEKDDKYGRYIAEVQFNNENINDLMVKKGYAVYAILETSFIFSFLCLCVCL